MKIATLKGSAAFGDSHMEGQTSPVVVGFKQPEMNVQSSLKKAAGLSVEKL
jgi:hypothetical protein